MYVCSLPLTPTTPTAHSANIQLFTASLLVYLLGLRLLTSNFVLIFIITILLLAMDFYYLKNIAGRRLVGLRWWNEVDANTGDGRWVFESADPETREINATDKRFFWLALYAQPVLWVVLAVVALVSLEFIWLTLVGESKSFCPMLKKPMRRIHGPRNKLGGKLTWTQSSHLSSPSRTHSPFQDATSSAKPQASPRVPCTVRALRGTWRVA